MKKEIKIFNIKNLINPKKTKETSNPIKANITKENTKLEKIKASIIGFTIGDALGVPVEFQNREILKHKKVIDMEEYGSHNQPKGTWSDDTSMVLATMDAIVNTPLEDMDSYEMFKNILDAFLRWKTTGEYTPYNEVFDIGTSTSHSIENYKIKKNKYNEETATEEDLKNLIDCGSDNIKSNGNGSLMRILPLAIYSNKLFLDDKTQKDFIYISSSLTHSHIYSKIGCLIYTKYIEYLFNDLTPKEAYNKLKDYFNNTNILEENKEIALNIYKRLLVEDISTLKEKEIKSTGYIVDTLEATIWTILTTNSYEEAVLKAVNLGEDTDTIGALVGSLAGVIYGYNSVPTKWLEVLKKKDYITTLTEKYYNKLNSYEKYSYNEEEEIATRNSWKNKDMPSEVQTLELKITLNTENLSNLKKGHIPKEMEDHWFIFYENNKLYIHRSWTGICIYIVDIPSDGHITKALVNRNKTQYNNIDDNEDVKTVTHLIYWYAGERKKAAQIQKETTSQ